MTSDRGKGIFIGWACKDITPDRPVNLYGQFHQRISERVHDPVTITALAMSTEQDHAVMVSCDICTINSDILERCRDAIGRKTPGLDVSKVILNATHTHTAPSIREGVYPPEPEGVMTASEYAGFFIRAVAEAVDMAWKRRKKGGVSWAYGHAVVGHNRRTSYFDTPGRRQGGERSSGRIIDGSSIMYGRTDDPDFSHMEGYEDHGMEMLFTWDAKKRLTGMIINLACPSQETEMATYISADFWHDIREEGRKRCGRKLFILPVQRSRRPVPPSPAVQEGGRTHAQIARNDDAAGDRTQGGRDGGRCSALCRKGDSWQSDLKPYGKDRSA